MFRFLSLSAARLAFVQAAVIDDGYDCRLRALAMDYAREVILQPWPSLHAEHAEQLVSDGLALKECGLSPAPQDSPRPVPQPPLSEVFVEEDLNLLSGGKLPAAASAILFIGPNGDDSAGGSRVTPLLTLAGAQARIRLLWPEPSTRPAISVFLLRGTYFNARAVFHPSDSGATPDAGITYSAEIGGDGVPVEATLSGGINLNSLGLSWEAAGPAGALRAKLPAGAPKIEAEEQLFLAGRPLVRARVPNGRPWVPMDGFTLTAGKNFTLAFTSMADIPASFDSCGPSEWNEVPAVPFGKCGEMQDGVDLTGATEGFDSKHSAGKTDDPAACAAKCAADKRCNFWTWHDEDQANFAHRCYVRYDWTYHFEPGHVGHVSGVCNHTLPGDGPKRRPVACEAAEAVCRSTDAIQWPSGSSRAYLGSASAMQLGTQIPLNDCIEKARVLREWERDPINDFPIEWTAGSYGYINPNDKSINKMDDSHNHPYWQGPWAGGISVDTTQDAGRLDLSAVSWQKPSDIVVHAMADGEWGGCQYRVADAPVEMNGSHVILKFQYGGWQQARTALLYRDPTEHAPTGERFYMEGSLEFLDDEGEWHFDKESDMLYIFPPADLGLSPAGMADAELVLTQRDCILKFVGEGAETGRNFVRNVAFANLTLAHTSAQFFKPHEETSGGDYAVHRGGAVFAENAGNLSFVGNTFEHIGGNAVFLSNAVRDVRISRNLFRFLGTSGVSVVGRTGGALGDGRDGEALMAMYGVSQDNGVRLPQRNTIDHNVFSDYGVWDKQSACFHRALAPDNDFVNNICFNSSRHAVNFEDSMGGGGKVEGNLVFNINRETLDTSAFNAWGRRTYLVSDKKDPAKPRMVPETKHSWSRNFILTRNYHSAGYQNGDRPYEPDAFRCDDGASWFNISSNVMYLSGVKFNGGSDVWTHGNLFIRGGWALIHQLNVGGSSYDTFVDTHRTETRHDQDSAWLAPWSPESCEAFCLPDRDGVRIATYRGDNNVAVLNSTGTAERVDWSKYWCDMPLEAWQSCTGQDQSTKEVNGGDDYSPEAILSRARRMLWTDALWLTPAV